MHYLSICCIAKDEPDLDEWARYHRAVGVEHVLIFDNESAIPIAQQLAPLVADGFVSVIHAKGSPAQMPAYDYFLQNPQLHATWTAFIDADEFLVPHRSDDLRILLKDYESFGGLVVNWLIFGSSGHRTRPPGLITENYLRRSEKSAQVNTHVKSIVQPARTLRCRGPHSFIYRPSFFAVNERMEFVLDSFSDNYSEIVQLNHYYLKSEEDYARKVKRGRADIPGHHEMKWFQESDAYCNAVVDESILRFLPRYKT